MDGADGTKAFDAFNAFSIGHAPGYRLQVGTRYSSHNLSAGK